MGVRLLDGIDSDCTYGGIIATDCAVCNCAVTVLELTGRPHPTRACCSFPRQAGDNDVSGSTTVSS